MTPDPHPADVGTVNQQVIHALLTADWPALDRLVPHEPLVDPWEEDDPGE